MLVTSPDVMEALGRSTEEIGEIIKAGTDNKVGTRRGPVPL